MSASATCFDKHGIPIERGDIVKVFHFVGARRKRHYMYKQCLGLSRYPSSPDGWQKVFFSHLNFREIGDGNGPYHEEPGKMLADYEIVQSIKCDHETRAVLKTGGPTCKNQGGDVHSLSAGCLVPGCFSEMGEACRRPTGETGGAL